MLYTGLAGIQPTRPTYNSDLCMSRFSGTASVDRRRQESDERTIPAAEFGNNRTLNTATVESCEAAAGH